MSVIHVDETALNQLKNALETAGQEYKSNLARLTNLIEEITSGDIQGDPANDLLAKFQAKQDNLNKLAKTIDMKTIVINPEIVKYDKKVLKYVVLHEFCHLKYKTHCKSFNDIMEENFENYIRIENELSGYKF